MEMRVSSAVVLGIHTNPGLRLLRPARSGRRHLGRRIFMDSLLMMAGAGIGGAVLSQGRTALYWARRRTVFSAYVAGKVYEAVQLHLSCNVRDTSVAYGQGMVDRCYFSGAGELTELKGRTGLGTRWVKIEGRRCLLTVNRDTLNTGYIESATIVVARKHEEWLREFIQKCVREFETNAAEGLQVFYYTETNYGNGGAWALACTRPYRNIDTIVHSKGAPREMLQIVRSWESRRAEYADRGENFHIGFLLSGPPGTGKTSTAVALASELKKPLYVVTGLNTENMLNLFNEVPSHAVLLIEECETLVANRQDEGKRKEHAAVGSLLSYLDGPMSKQGIVRIYTTNYPEKLDPSFMREGRCDKHYKFSDCKANSTAVAA